MSLPELKFLPTQKTRSQEEIFEFRSSRELFSSTEFSIGSLVDDSEKLPARVKLAYGYGGVSQYLYALILGLYMLSFFRDRVNVDPLYAAAIQMGGSIYGAVVNLIIGYLSDLSPHPRRLSWIAFATIPVAYFYFIFWMIPFSSDVNNVTYYTCIYLILSTFFGCYVVPYNSLSAEITLSYDERTRLSGYRWTLSLSVGTIAVLFQALLLHQYPDYGYSISGFIVGVFLLTPGAILCWMVKEREILHNKFVTTSFLRGMKITLSNSSFIMVLFINSCAWSALTQMMNVFQIYVKFVINEPNCFPYVTALTLGVCTISIPIYVWLTGIIGKKLVYFLGTMILIFGILPTNFLSSEDPLFIVFILSFITGAGLGVLYLIPYSMVPDIVEMDELLTGQRREGMFFSVFVSFERMAVGITTFLSGVILKIGGFEVDESDQSNSAIICIKLLLGIAPVITLLLSLLACYYYPITKKVHAKILANLGNRNSSVISVNADDNDRIHSVTSYDSQSE